MMTFILAAYNVDVHAEELGRLFTTPAERGLLDKIRNHKPSSLISASSADDHNIMQQTPVPETFYINGVVYRKRGRSTIWINNTQRTLDVIHIVQPSPATGMLDSGDVLINIPDYDASIRLRTGTARQVNIAR